MLAGETSSFTYIADRDALRLTDCIQVSRKQRTEFVILKRRLPMAKKPAAKLNAQPHIHQRAREIQEYGSVSHALPLEL